MSHSVFILDIGSFTTTGGFAGENNSMFSEPTVLGLPKYKIFDTDADVFVKERYIGSEAVNLFGILVAKRPFDQIPYDWNDVTNYLHELILNTKVQDPKSLFILFITPVSWNEDIIKNIAEITLSNNYVKGIQFLSHPKSILNSSEKKSALIIDIGENSTRISSFFENKPLLKTSILKVSGKNLSNILLKELDLSEIKTKFKKDIIIDEIKKKYFFLHPSIKNEEEMNKVFDNENISEHYKVADYLKPIQINQNCFLIPELMFSTGNDDNLIHGIIKHLKNINEEILSNLLSNIILVGGTTNIPGFHERIVDELEKNFGNIKITVNKNLSSDKRVWIGANIFVSNLINTITWISSENQHLLTSFLFLN